MPGSSKSENDGFSSVPSQLRRNFKLSVSIDNAEIFRRIYSVNQILPSCSLHFSALFLAGPFELGMNHQQQPSNGTPNPPNSMGGSEFPTHSNIPLAAAPGANHGRPIAVMTQPNIVGSMAGSAMGMQQPNLRNNY